MDFNKFFASKLFKGILAGIAGLIILLLVFEAGSRIGFRKANFSYKWGENYHRNFGGPRGGFFGEAGYGDSMMGAHGVYGKIIKITGSELTVKDGRNVENAVVIKSDTTVTRFMETIKATDLKVNDYVVVIGEPNDAGQVDAKLIRVMPAPGAMMPPPPGAPGPGFQRPLAQPK